MKLSVIVPIYNVESFLPKCLDSLIRQSYKDLEILLINDGSTDHSAQIALEAQKEYPHLFHVLDKENGGLSDARNFGILHAQGEYLGFIDSDDTISPLMFEKMMRVAENDQCDVVVCGMDYVYEDGTRKYASGGEFDIIDPKRNINILTINNSACNKIFKRSLFNGIEFPKGKWYEDLATIPIILYRAQRIGNVHDALYFYLQRTGSIAHRKHQKMFEIYEAIQFVEKTLQPEVSDVKDFKRVIGSLYITHGLFLTTLRIKEIENLFERADYLKQNIQHLDRYYPIWRIDDSMSHYPIKTKIVFKLLSWGKYLWVSKIYQ